MSGYAVIKDGQQTPVHNLATGLYLVARGEADSVIDLYSGRIIQK